MRIYHIAKKEVLQTFRDKRMLLILLFAPIFQLIIFGYAANYDIKLIPTAIVDQDNSRQSRELIAKLVASGYFRLIAYPRQVDTLTELIDRGEIWCGIVFPTDFQRKLMKGQMVGLQVILDGTNSNTAGIAASYLGRIVQTYSLEITRRSASLRSAVLPVRAQIALRNTPIETRLGVWYNPNLYSRTYNVPAVLVNIMLVITMVLTSMAVVREKELGTIEQISVTPIKPYELMIGKTLPFVIVGTVDLLAVTTVAIFWFKIPFLGSIWFLLLSSFIFMLTTLGIGLLISTFSSTQQQAMMTTFFFIMPFSILSGFAFPISNMPKEIQYFTFINPVRYFVEILRDVFLKGSGFSQLKGHLLALLIIGIGVMALSVIRFRKRIG